MNNLNIIKILVKKTNLQNSYKRTIVTVLEEIFFKYIIIIQMILKFRYFQVAAKVNLIAEKLSLRNLITIINKTII